MTQVRNSESQAIAAPDDQGEALSKKTAANKTSRKPASKTVKAPTTPAAAKRGRATARKASVPQAKAPPADISTAQTTPEQAPDVGSTAIISEKKTLRPGKRGRARGGKSMAVLDIPEQVDTRAPGTPNGVATWQAPDSSGSAAPEDPESSGLTIAAEPQTPHDPSTENDMPVESGAEADEALPAQKRKRSRRGGRRKKKAVAQAGAAAPEEPSLTAAASSDAYSVAPAKEIPGPPPDQTSELASVSVSTHHKDLAAGREEPEEDAAEDTHSGKRKMFVSVLAGEQVEVVLAEEGIVQEYYVEMLHQAKVKGNIYKGIISNVDANLQAAFVNYGGVKNGFLQIDEVHPEYYLVPHDSSKSHKFPLIQKALKPGQEILVQVAKEPAGTKGAFLTSYLSLPGRFLVLTPGREQIGVSRKVENEEERVRLRAMLQGLTPGAGLGVIIRTVSVGASKTNLQRDLQFLKRLWKEVRAKGREAPSPSLIYQELALSTRAVRDYLTDDVQELWVDDEVTAHMVEGMATLLFPRKQNLVRAHTEPSTLFERFNLQKQLDQIHSREVVLPSGGRLVFDNTEALTAIDINSGRSGGKSNFEDMAYRTNLEAAKMIPLQLRLRDIGGQVVADFIEMRDRDHWREVEKTLRVGMKGDRARYDVGKVGPFGMLEMVRQRLGSSAISVSTEPCPCCKGTGVRRNMEWQAMQALRDIQHLVRQAAAQKQPEVAFAAERALALYLLNAKRQVLLGLETQSSVHISINIVAE